MIKTTLKKHSERVRIRRSAIYSPLLDEIIMMNESLKESSYMSKTESTNSQTNHIHQYITIEEENIINDILS
jgi:hypothetical protein